ncbi:hypothetical protein D3C83_46880 [compost metagenome]
MLDQLRQGFRLPRAETGLALDLENHRDLDTGCALDLVIAVVERFAEAPGEQFAHRGLARSHQSHQEDVPGYRSFAGLYFLSAVVHGAILTEPAGAA